MAIIILGLVLWVKGGVKLYVLGHNFKWKKHSYFEDLALSELTFRQRAKNRVTKIFRLIKYLSVPPRHL
jgi:hypothetical protein